jgi:hypothetical protein
VDEFFADKPESVIPLTDGAGTIAIRKHKGADPSDSWYLRKRRGVFTQGWVDASTAGPTQLFLGDGWAQPEEWGVWGLGQSHILNVYLSVPIAEYVEIDCDVHVVLLAARKVQHVNVFAGTQLLDTWEFVPNWNRAIRRLRVPAASIVSDVVTIEFRPHEVGSPAELDPTVTDTRPLGLALHRVRLFTPE